MKNAIEVGSKIKYQGRQGTVTDMWDDGDGPRAEVEIGRDKQIWTVTLKTLLELNPKYKLGVIK